MRILTLNPGSSSLKAAVVHDGAAVGWAAWQSEMTRAVVDTVERWPRPDGVAVRFVHGGAQKTPVLVTGQVVANPDRLVPLAPLHQPLSLDVTRQVRDLPGVPVVACFDTAFHADLPDAAAHYPLPREWTRQNRLRRTSRRTPTRSWRWPRTACAAGTWSTWWSRARTRHRPGSTPRRPHCTAHEVWASGNGPARTRTANRTSCSRARATLRPWKSSPRRRSCARNCRSWRFAWSTWWLQPETEHRHGLSDWEFDALFTPDRPVIFAYHGYPWLIHRLAYRRTNHAGLHVRGYTEHGTTTTPFDMLVRNRMDRFQLVIDVLDRVPGLLATTGPLRQRMTRTQERHRHWITEHGEDLPEVREWR
ncbi:Xylulose-5-phosphate phosphoketolase [Amycolatopsis sp. M39]|nr:Xylulose-5-phosphate phosphoketolase [Amycolatopsis sp. M39]